MNGTKRVLFSWALAVVCMVLCFPGTHAQGTIFGANAHYTLLVLDVSGSMADASMAQMKEAARSFVSTIHAEKRQNHVGVIAYSNDAKLICDFSDDLTTLYGAIESIDDISRGGTNTYAALSLARDVFSSAGIPSNAIKNLVLMTDGVPNNPPSSSVGLYTQDDCDYLESGGYIYEFANSVYSLASEIKKDVRIYALGFFQDFSYPENILAFVKRCLRDLQSHGYYEVEKAEEFVFAFGEIAEVITSAEAGEEGYLAVIAVVVAFLIYLFFSLRSKAEDKKSKGARRGSRGVPS